MWYSFVVENCFTPPAFTEHTYYFGDKDMLQALVDPLRTMGKREMRQFYEGFDAYFDENQKDVEVKLGNKQKTLIREAELVETHDFSLEETEFPMKNVFEYEYKFKFASAKATKAVFKVGDEFFLCVKAEINNLMKIGKNGETPVRNPWGFPSFFEIHGDNYITRVYRENSRTDTLEKAQAWLKNLERSSLATVFEEILAAG